MSNLFFTLNIPSKKIANLNIVSSVVSDSEDKKELKIQNPCGACPNVENTHTYNKKTFSDAKYLKNLVLDTDIALRNKYSKNVVNLDSNIHNIGNNIQKIISNHYVK